jgi:hypothetical protein
LPASAWIVVWIFILVEAMAFAVVVVAVMTAKSDPDEARGRLLDWPELGLQGRIGGSCPVLGEGTFGGYSFSFFAQNDSWTFDVTQRLVEPSTSLKIECLYHLEGEAVGSSYLPFNEAEQIIQDCVRKFHLRNRPIAQ